MHIKISLLSPSPHPSLHLLQQLLKETIELDDPWRLRLKAAQEILI
jgi:hypothetical protein